ncbi:MAG: DUF1583 domain-containing protein [Pirellulaceae bacterium]
MNRTEFWQFVFPRLSRQSNPVAFALVLASVVGLPALPAAGQYSVVQSFSQPSSDSRLSERQLAALDLALLAARKGLHDVSYEAVKRAVGDGPPVSGSGLGGLLSSGQQQAQMRSSPSQDTDQQAQVARRLTKISRAWDERQADPTRCYQLLKSVVFPPDRPSAGFTYSSTVESTSFSYNVNLNDSAPEPVESGAALLVHWARRAERLDDLLTEVEAREKLPGARSTALLLRILTEAELAKDAVAQASPDDAQEDTASDGDSGNSTLDPTRVEQLFEQLARMPEGLVSGRDAELVMYATWQLLERLPEDFEPRQHLWQGIIEATGREQRWASNRWLRHAVHSELQGALKQGERERFFKFADVWLSILDPIGANNADYAASQRANFYASAARQAFADGNLVLGVECMRRQSGLNTRTQPSIDFSNVVQPGSDAMRQLLDLSPDERLSMFWELAWRMPQLGLGSAAVVAPRDEIPEEFVRAYHTEHQTERLPLEQVTSRESLSVSLLEWLMRDAIWLGRQQQVEGKLAELKSRKSDDWGLARLVYDKAKGRPLDLSLVTSAGEDGEPRLRASVQGKGMWLPIDYEIAATAIRDPTTRQQGIELAERLEGRGLANSQNQVFFGRHIAALGRLAQQDSSAVSSDVLKHFVRADDYRSSDRRQGKLPTSAWLEESAGAWEHLSGIDRDSLLLKYPLQGSFDIHLACTDQAWGEGATMYGGYYVDFEYHASSFYIDSIGFRCNLRAPTESMRRDATPNQYRLKRSMEDDSLSLHCNGEFVERLDLPLDSFPFFGLHSRHLRRTVTSDVQIEGNVEIPDKVDLISPSLIGWSPAFCQQRMSRLVEDFNRPKELKALPKGNESRAYTYSWHSLEDRIESVDFSELEADDVDAFGQPRRESWLYYLRPLCDGESVEFEFYRKEGAYSVWPTIDRRAIVLDPAGLRQHWITSDSGRWFGVEATNQIAVPEGSSMHELTLNEGDWNHVRLRREGEYVILAVNHTDVYRQPVDDSLGGRFGLFNDPQQFHVRVRNASLTGDWPEQLPADLFEKKFLPSGVAE